MQEPYDDQHQDLEDFIAIAVKDLTAPLADIAAQAALAQSDRLASATTRACLERIASSAQQASRVLAGLDQFATKTSARLQFEATDFNKLLESVVGALKPQIEQAHASVTVGHLPSIEVRHEQIFHVFSNLIDNAIKYRRDIHPHVRVSAVRNNRDWIFAVQDNGQGIDPKRWESIFHLFRWTGRERARSGTVGLAVCKKIVEKHGGRIWVQSVPREGTTFYFSLPSKR
jgi:light-regulated signal transduction histidine kinase (bacteriophytochrome)